MDKYTANLIRLAAAYAESENPSRKFMSHMIELAADSAKGDEEARVALIKGLMKKVVKPIKNKLFKSEGEKKNLKKIKKYEQIKKEIPSVIKSIERGESIKSIVNDDEIAAGTLFLSLKKVDEESVSKEFISNIPDSPEEIEAFAESIDDWWEDDGESYEDDDRDGIVKALKSMSKECDSRIAELKKRIEKMKSKLNLFKIIVFKTPNVIVIILNRFSISGNFHHIKVSTVNFTHFPKILIEFMDMATLQSDIAS